MKRLVLMALSSVVALTAISGHAAAPARFSVAAFEKSAVFRAYHLQQKDSWTLKAGGMNFSYIFDDPGLPGESMTLELQGSATDIRSFDVSWPGDLPVNRLDPWEARVIQQMLAVFAPGQNSAPIIAYVRAAAGRQYPGGGDSMPRKRFGALKVAAGQSILLSVTVAK